MLLPGLCDAASDPTLEGGGLDVLRATGALCGTSLTGACMVALTRCAYVSGASPLRAAGCSTVARPPSLAAPEASLSTRPSCATAAQAGCRAASVSGGIGGVLGAVGLPTAGNGKTPWGTGGWVGSGGSSGGGCTGWVGAGGMPSSCGDGGVLQWHHQGHVRPP